jgi:hypothetical protein
MSDIKKYRGVHETPAHFVLHDGKAHFHIAKKGLDKQTVERIQKFYEGGPVKSKKEQMQDSYIDATSPQDEGPTPAEKIKEKLKEYLPSFQEGGEVLDSEEKDRQDLEEMRKNAEGYVEIMKTFPIQNFAGDEGVASQEVQPIEEPMSVNYDVNAPVPSMNASTPMMPIPTVVPQNQQVSVAPQAPATPVTTTPAVVEDERMRPIESLADAEQRANQATFDIADAQVKAASDTANAMRSQYEAELKQQQFQQKHMKEIDDRNAKLFEEASSGKIDANRLWANTSTAGKIAAGLGMMLGGAAGGYLGQANPAIAYINKAIDNDIEAQKADQSNKMNAYKLGLERYRDAQSAATFAQLQGQTLLTAKLQQIAATSKSPIIKAAAQQEVVDRYTKMAPLKMELAQRALALDLTSGGGPRNINIEGLAPELKERAIKVPGGVTLANTKEDAKELKEMLPIYDDIENDFKQMKSDLDEYGRGILPKGQVKQRSDSLKSTILLKMKNLRKAGALSEKEIELFEQIIPGSGDIFSDAARVKIDRALIDLMRNRKLTLKYRTAGSERAESKIDVGPPVSNKQMKKIGR